MIVIELDSGIKTGDIACATVDLPWPPSNLSPNKRLHWGALSKLKKRYRAECAKHAQAAGLRKISANALHLRIEFVPPSKHHRDLDNMLASMKSGLDGLADVLGVDDSQWTLDICKADQIGGYVRVTITWG